MCTRRYWIVVAAGILAVSSCASPEPVGDGVDNETSPETRSDEPGEDQTSPTGEDRTAVAAAAVKSVSFNLKPDVIECVAGELDDETVIAAERLVIRREINAVDFDTHRYLYGLVSECVDAEVLIQALFRSKPDDFVSILETPPVLACRVSQLATEDGPTILVGLAAQVNERTVPEAARTVLVDAAVSCLGGIDLMLYVDSLGLGDVDADERACLIELFANGEGFRPGMLANMELGTPGASAEQVQTVISDVTYLSQGMARCIGLARLTLRHSPEVAPDQYADVISCVDQALAEQEISIAEPGEEFVDQLELASRFARSCVESVVFGRSLDGG